MQGRRDHVGSLLRGSESTTNAQHDALRAHDEHRPLDAELNPKRRTGIRTVDQDQPRDSDIFGPRHAEPLSARTSLAQVSHSADRIGPNLECSQDVWEESRRLRKPAMGPDTASLAALAKLISTKLRNNNLTADELFTRLDYDRDGLIQLDQLRPGLRRVLGMSIEDNVLERLCLALDPQKRTSVSKNRFLAFCAGEDVQLLRATAGLSINEHASPSRARASSLSPRDVESPKSAQVAEAQRLLDTIREKIRGRGLRLQRIFLDMDTDRSGSLDATEIQRGLRRFGIDLELKQISVLLHLLDSSGDGAINYEEFVRALSQDSADDFDRAEDTQRRKAQMHTDAAQRAVADSSQSRRLRDIRMKLRERISGKFAAARDAFLKLDTDCSGALSKNEFRRFLRDSQLNLTLPEMEALIATLDSDSSGEISFDEFRAFIEMDVDERNASNAKADAEAQQREALRQKLTKAGLLDRIVEKLSVHNEDADRLFSKFDRDRTGRLTQENMHRALRAMNVSLSNGDFRALFDILDPTSSGLVPYGMLAELLVDPHVRSASGNGNEFDDDDEDGGSVKRTARKQFAEDHAKTVAALRSRMAHRNDSQINLADKPKQTDERLNQTETADLRVFLQLSKAVTDRTRFLDAMVRADKQDTGCVLHEQFRRILTDTGSVFPAPAVHRMILRLDRMRTGYVDIRTVMEFLDNPRAAILSQREQSETQGVPDSPAARLERRMSIGEMRMEPSSPKSDKNMDDLMGEYDQIFDFEISASLMSMLQTTLTKLAREYPRLLYVLKDEYCTASSLRKACHDIGFLVAGPDFSDVFRALDTEQIGRIATQKIALLASRALQYLKVRGEEDSVERNRKEAAFIREYKPRTPYADHVSAHEKPRGARDDYYAGRQPRAPRAMRVSSQITEAFSYNPESPRYRNVVKEKQMAPAEKNDREPPSQRMSRRQADEVRDNGRKPMKPASFDEDEYLYEDEDEEPVDDGYGMEDEYEQMMSRQKAERQKLQQRPSSASVSARRPRY
jgi:Ca2+-binding EF-hand superfamily protein